MLAGGREVGGTIILDSVSPAVSLSWTPACGGRGEDQLQRSRGENQPIRDRQTRGRC